MVALFNAVAEAQRLQEEVASKSSDMSGLKNDSGESMNKSDFLDMLSKQSGGKAAKKKKAGDASSSSSSALTGTSGLSKEEETTPAYLREDFMKGASIKHWDQEDSEADEADGGDDGRGDDSGSSDSGSDSD